MCLQLFDIVARKFRRQIAGGLRQQLHLRAVFKHDDADHRFLDRRTGNDDTVILQEHTPPRTKRTRDAGAHGVAADEIDGVGIGAERFVEQRAGLAVASERAAGRRQRGRVIRMGINHAIDVGTDFEDFGVDIDLAVPPRGAGDDIAFEIDGQDVSLRDLIETNTVRLHEKETRLVRQAEGNMPAGKVVLALGHQHFAGGDQFLLDDIMSRRIAVRLNAACFRRCLFCHIPHPGEFPALENRGMGKVSRGNAAKDGR